MKARITLTLPPMQISWLQREAKKLGISISELLRRIVDEKRIAK